MTSRYLELAPTNKTTDGKYAHKNGVASLNFSIPEGNYVLDPASVRICGDVQFFTDADKTSPAAGFTGQLGINTRLGVYSCFDQLIWRSSKHQTTISHERNWNRWLSSYLSQTASKEDSLTHLGQSSLTMPNWEIGKRSVVDKNVGNSFAVHLPCGLLNSGQSIPLTGNTLGGLDLSIMLASDAQALQVLPADIATPPAIANFLGAHYELSNVKLVCSVITPPIDQLTKLLKQTSGGITYQSIHSFYDTANSSNIQVSMNLALSKVKSLFINIIESSKLQNLAEDSFATICPVNSGGTLASIKNIAWLRGGTTYPKLFPHDTNFKETPTVIVSDPDIQRDYINSITNFNKARNSQGSLANTNRNYRAVAGGISIPYQFVNDSGVVWGLGVNYENYLGGAGVDFRRELFGLALDVDLTTNASQSLFIFANAESNILWNQNGIQLLH